MRVACRMILLASVASVASLACDDEPHQAKTQAAPSAPASANDADDFEVETVDDTVPPDTPSAEVVEAADDDADEGDGEGSAHEACAPKEAGLKPMQVLRFTFTDGIEGKDPKSKLSVAKAGQRVYAHLAMRNRSGKKRCLHLTFRVGGKKRTEVTLPIGKSWQWRTYAYNTLRADDDKPLELTVTDDQGALVLKKMLPVIPRKNP